MPNAQPIRAVAISGSPARSSRSKTLLQHALALLARAGVPGRLIDLAEIPADVLLGRTRSAVIADAIGQVAAAQIVVDSTPVYRASYSGLLKVFFDLLPPAALAGKVSVPIASAGSAGHQLMLDHALHPLLASLGALNVPSAVFVIDAQFRTRRTYFRCAGKAGGRTARSRSLVRPAGPCAFTQYLIGVHHVKA